MPGQEIRLKTLSVHTFYLVFPQTPVAQKDFFKLPAF